MEWTGRKKGRTHYTRRQTTSPPLFPNLPPSLSKSDIKHSLAFLKSLLNFMKASLVYVSAFFLIFILLASAL